MIENKFINGILQAFRTDYKLSDLSESKIYEFLVNDVIVWKRHPTAFDDTTMLKDLDVDGGGNFGIDGITIIVNNNLVLSIEDLDILKIVP